MNLGEYRKEKATSGNLQLKQHPTFCFRRGFVAFQVDLWHRTVQLQGPLDQHVYVLVRWSEASLEISFVSGKGGPFYVYDEKSTQVETGLDARDWEEVNLKGLQGKCEKLATIRRLHL